MRSDHFRRWVGRPMPRREDPELLAGKGRYIGDLTRPGMLHATFLRSPLPHARIAALDAEEARRMPGVRAILTAAAAPEGRGAQPGTHLSAGQRETPYYALTGDRVRYAGEPVALVVAESQYLAEDARDAIVVEWDALPSVGDVEAAVADDAPRLYDDWPDNVVAVFEKEMGDVDRAFEQADVVVTERL